MQVETEKAFHQRAVDILDQVVTQVSFKITPGKPVM